MAKEASEGGYKNVALLDPPTCLPEFAFWPQTGGRDPHCKAPISFGRDKSEKRGLCPRKAVGVVCLTLSGFWLWKKLVVEKPEICMFSQTGSSAFVQYFSSGGKPGSHQARILEGGWVKEFGGGAEKSHKNYLRAGKNAYERREEFILFPSSD